MHGNQSTIDLVDSDCECCAYNDGNECRPEIQVDTCTHNPQICFILDIKLNIQMIELSQ